MDPNANLNEQTRLAYAISRCEKENCHDCPRQGKRLADLVEALDEWIKKGGALPADWTGKRNG